MRMKQKFSIAIIAGIAMLGASPGALGQADKPAKKKADVAIEKFETAIVAGAGDSTMVFVSSELSFGGEVVTGAPYSAEAVTESIQVLSDGNRIVRKSSSNVYRDSQGRTRHETTLGKVGSLSAGEPRQSIFINDPVAGVNYILHPSDHSARKIHTGPGGFKDGARFEIRVPAPAGEGHGVGKGHGVDVEWHSSNVVVGPVGPGFGAMAAGGRALKLESRTEALGKQTIEGVEAEGKRSVATIPAGEIGNELPIEIVTETWFSPELKTVVMRRHHDPRHGETIYRLSNINRTEPSASLFQVPSDYSIKESDVILHNKMIREKMKARKSKEDQ